MDIIGNRTLRGLWEDLVARSGDDPFLVFEDRDGSVTRYGYAEFATLIARTANLFRDLGVQPGDRVGVHLHNSPELLMAMFGLTWIGAVFVPLHPRSTRTESAGILADVEADLVVVEPGVLSLYTGDDGIPVRTVLLARAGSAEPGVLCFEDERDRHPDTLVDRVPLDSEDPAMMVFTSGTTARPKGVVLTHCNLLFSGEFVDWQARIGPDDRLLTTMPACHVNFQLNALMPVLTAGATLIAVEKYHASTFWRQVCDYRATVVQSIAMMVRTMLLQPDGEWEREHAVREVLYYLPITDEEKARFEERFGVRILNSYGTSESLVGVITDPPHGERRWPSIGRVGLGYEARIADTDGRELPPHALGEIQVRGVPGRTLMKEYYRNPAATAELFDEDGWMHTGDLGYVDEDGWFFFQDRLTHLIKRAGENISPAEIEAVLARHPLVVTAAVVGVPDPMYDEAVKAVIVPGPDAELTEEAVRDYCAAYLAAFKVPTIVEFVDELPQTVSFKVAKSSLGSPRQSGGDRPCDSPG